MLSNLEHKKGFTLIEMLTVLALISALFTIFFNYLHDARQKAINNSVVRSAVSLRTALELYVADNDNLYPGDVAIGGGTQASAAFVGKTRQPDGSYSTTYGPNNITDSNGVETPIDDLLNEYFVNANVLESPIVGQLYAYFRNQPPPSSDGLSCFGEIPKYVILIGATNGFKSDLPYAEQPIGTPLGGSNPLFYCLPGAYQ